MGRSRNSFTLWAGQANIQESAGLHAEQRLFVAVLSQAVHDAFSTHVPELEKQQAQSWLIGNSKDFRSVCEHAGRDSGYVQEKIRKKILKASGWNVDLSLKVTTPRARRRMRKYQKEGRHLTGNAYYAAKRQSA